MNDIQAAQSVANLERQNSALKVAATRFQARNLKSALRHQSLACSVKPKTKQFIASAGSRRFPE